MRNEIIDKAQKFINNNEYLNASYALEFLLNIYPNDVESRLVLAKIYIILKENIYRSKARAHLEFLIPITKDETLKKVLKLIITNVYLTNGPILNAKKIIDEYYYIFNQNELKVINTKISELNRYIGLDKSSTRSSTLPQNISEFNNFDYAAKNFIFKEFFEMASKHQRISRFFTFGSCFAGNVAREMKKKKINVESFWVGEEVNTTFSNLNLINYI